MEQSGRSSHGRVDASARGRSEGLPGAGMNQRLLYWGLIALCIIAAMLLGLIGWVLWLIRASITPEGNIPSGEAFGLTGLLLAFREVLGRISGLWEHEEKANLT